MERDTGRIGLEGAYRGTFLTEQLSLATPPCLHPATITQGIVRHWSGKYKALVDGSAAAEVEGWAYLVTSKDHEDQLRYYETDRYEVVRCDTRFNQDKEEHVKGLTFRFVG